MDDYRNNSDDNNFSNSIIANNNSNSLIVTHNARLRCLITKLFNNSGEQQNEILRQQIKNFRWQNCCVLKLIIEPNSQMQNNNKKLKFVLSLIYDGEIDPTENKPTYQYWANNPATNNTISQKKKGCIGSFCKKSDTTTPQQLRFNTFNNLIGSINVNDLSDTKIVGAITNINKVFTFYLVRHSQAEHNLYTKTTIKRKTDTSLTDFGVKTTKDAGIAINSDLNGKIEYYFASDLIRTRETFSGILNGITLGNLSFKKINNINVIDIIILPCSHELAFSSDGQCDETSNAAQLFTSENNMSCTKLNNYLPDTVANEYKNCVTFNSDTSDAKVIKININWEYYTRFYNNSYRYIDKNPFKKKQGERCRDTSMIEQAISIITNVLPRDKNDNFVTMENYERLQGGRNRRKTRKRRKTKKLRKRRNKRKTSKHL